MNRRMNATSRVSVIDSPLNVSGVHVALLVLFVVVIYGIYDRIDLVGSFATNYGVSNDG